MTDLPDEAARSEKRERMYERMDPVVIVLDREPVGGPIPQLTASQLRELGID